MQAAITAATRGHNVTLCEASDSRGGSLKFASYVPCKKDLYDFEQVLEKRLKNSSAKVLLNTKVNKEYVENLNPDALIIAAGATPFVPPIKGIQNENVLLALDAESNPSKIGQKVVILGGGLVGCETAINLYKEGKDVTIVEMRSSLAPDANDFHKMAMNMELENIKKETKTTGKYIDDKGIMCTNEKGDEIFIEADTIICAVGLKPCTDVVEELTNLTSEYYIIGDCKRPRQVTQAVLEAYYAALDI